MDEKESIVQIFNTIKGERIMRPDLECDEIGYSNFRVIGNDPHGFDRDNDGIGCES
ncbi:MAG: excalibur calcium-binding domain-containing protein [Nitrosopumilus sp.]